MRSNCRRYIFYLFFLLQVASINAVAQRYYFRHYQVENGLSNNAAIVSLLDKQGFVWFGTKDGLNRFDGYSFKVFRNDPADSGSIGNNFIHCLFEDNKGTLWAGTEKGLYSYDPIYESFRLLPASANFPVGDIKMDGSGNLWFAQAFVLKKYDPKTHLTTIYPNQNLFEVTSICTDHTGRLWAASPNGNIHYFDPERNAFIGYDLFAATAATGSRWIEKIVATTTGKILAGTTDGVKIFDIQQKRTSDILARKSESTGIFVRNFLEKDSAEIWIASENGIYIYNAQTGSITNLRKAYNDPYSISDNAVYTFCQDREGGIWAGTYFGGVNYFPKQHTAFRKYFPKTGENSLSGNVVREIHADTKGNLWIGTEDAGLNKFDTATGLFTVFKPTGVRGSIAYPNIHGLLIDSNKLWIGTFEHGLDVMDLAKERVTRHYNGGTLPGTMNSNFIYCITKNNSGDILLGTTRGAFRYNRSDDNFLPLEGMPLNNWYSFLLADHTGSLWAATYGNGVNFYDPATQQAINYRYHAGDSNSIASDRVNSIFEDSQDNLWFATEGGLSVFNRASGIFKTFQTADGLPSNFILSILEDDQHHLWLSTSKGIASFDPSSGRTRIYTSANGLLNDQFNFNSAFKSPDGRLYFGSVKGMVSFQPKDFTRNTFIAPVYITGFQVNNKELQIGQNGSALNRSISYTNEITLPHNQSTFSIDFAALSFTAPEMSEYAYRMDGLDKQWTYLKQNRKAYFTNLSPGNYVFKVKATNSSGLWNNNETQLRITVLPPWWASNLAYAFYTIVAIAFVLFIIRYYHNRTEARNRRKYELLKTAKEKEVYEAKIEFFTNVAHEIKTPLTLIKAPLEKVIKKADGIPEITNNLQIMDRNTNRLIELTNQLLDFRQTELHGFSLSFVRANISEILEETYTSFKPLADQKDLNFQIKLPSKTVYAYVDIDAFKKIIYNLYSNAVKYAKTLAVITLQPLKSTDKIFTVQVKSDGYSIPSDMKEKIFEPFFRLRETENQKGTGIGLALSRSLAELHKGTLVLKDEDKGKNIFCLALPVHQQNEFDLYKNNETQPPLVSNNTV